MVDQKFTAEFFGVIASEAKQSRQKNALFALDCFVGLRPSRNDMTENYNANFWLRTLAAEHRQKVSRQDPLRSCQRIEYREVVGAVHRQEASRKAPLAPCPPCPGMLDRNMRT